MPATVSAVQFVEQSRIGDAAAVDAYVDEDVIKEMCSGTLTDTSFDTAEHDDTARLKRRGNHRPHHRGEPGGANDAHINAYQLRNELLLQRRLARVRFQPSKS